MLPVAVWDMPPLGTYNLHASLLPQYRGAAPINWAIINGESETGVSTFKLKHEIDTGDLLVQESCKILPEDNAGTLHNKLMYMGADAIVETLNQISEGIEITIPQNENQKLKSAPKLFTHNTEINWNANGDSIVNLVRGLNPYPTAHTVFDNKKILVYEVEFEPRQSKYNPGTFLSDGKKYLSIVVNDGIIHLKDIKIQGKRRMSVKDLLNGYDLSHLNLESL
ncbi:MAG: methionyl-tRNA formyltransferase, partial [Bacteroidia bacterium]